MWEGADDSGSLADSFVRVIFITLIYDSIFVESQVPSTITSITIIGGSILLSATGLKLLAIDKYSQNGQNELGT